MDWEPCRASLMNMQTALSTYMRRSPQLEGDKLGGRGFVVAVSGAVDRSLQFLCLVTNRHIVESGNSTARINMKDGKHDAIDDDERSRSKALFVREVFGFLAAPPLT